jgi:hypothetical protein
MFGNPPRVSCDSPGCEARIEINGLPPAWLLKRKAPRGWKTLIIDDFRRDWCPPHKYQAAQLLGEGTTT